MRKVIASEWMTLDGGVQAPSYADEDVTGDFVQGGRHARYFDEMSVIWDSAGTTRRCCAATSVPQCRR